MNLKEYVKAWENVLSNMGAIKELAPHSREEDHLKCRDFFRQKIERVAFPQISFCFCHERSAPKVKRL